MHCWLMNTMNGVPLPPFPFPSSHHLEDAHFSQRFEVYMHGDLGLQFVRQHFQHLGIAEALLVGPQIVKPFDDAHFQLNNQQQLITYFLPSFPSSLFLSDLSSNSTQIHVFLDGVNSILEFRAAGTHIRNHAIKNGPILLESFPIWLIH